MILEQAHVIENAKLSQGLYNLSFYSPEIAGSAQSGQFIHVEVSTEPTSILRRPFCVFDTNAQKGSVEVLYQVAGKCTSSMSQWKPDLKTSLIGPIGNGWQISDDFSRVLLVGGGVGAAPLLMLCNKLVSSGVNVDVVLGAQTKDGLAFKERFEQLHPNSILYATDDGTYGMKGFCTVCVDKLLHEANTPYDCACICGPEPMMRAVSSMTLEKNIHTQVSLEKMMACGVGACLSCTCETKDVDNPKRRVCVDGPVFDAEFIRW